MNIRAAVVILMSAALVLGMPANVASGVDVIVAGPGPTDISTLVTANDTVLVFIGNATITVDQTTTKTLAGINAGGNAVIFAFNATTNRVLLGNSAGNVVIQPSGGDISVTGTNAIAGFIVSPSLSGTIVDISGAVIDDATNANNWIIADNTLKFSGAAGQVGTVSIGGAVATIDADQNVTIGTITPSGDLTIDLAASKTLTVTNALSVGANTLTIKGAGSTSVITATGGINLNNASSKLSVSGSIALSNLDVGAAATVTLADGVTLTLTDVVTIGANTLTVAGTTGTAAETITALAGLRLDNAASELKINGDTANPLVISRVDITGADLNTGKGINADQSTDITALAVAQNATVDVAAGKHLGGTITLNAAKTLTLNNTGTINAISTTATAGTVKITGATTITTLTNTVAGTTLDIDESVTITTTTATESMTLDVASGKTLTTTATVAAAKILTAAGAGTITTVKLNGALAELNMTAIDSTVTMLDVIANGGILDFDASNCTIGSCNMTAGAGDLTLENGGRTVTVTNGIDVNDNELKFTQASGTLNLVILDTAGGKINVDDTTSITTLTITADTTLDVAGVKTLNATVVVPGGRTLTYAGPGTTSAITLNGAGAELLMSAGGTIPAVNVNANGGVIDVDKSCTISLITMKKGSGNATVDVASGKILTATIDVNDNTLTLIGTGVPGSIRLDTDGGSLDVDANSTPTVVTVSANIGIDVADGKTLTGRIDIGSRTLSLRGSGTVSRIDSTIGTVTASGSTTIGDLRPSFGGGGTFTYDGVGDSTITTLANASLGTGATFLKKGTGTLTIQDGFSAMFAKAPSVHLDIDAGEVVLGSAGVNDDITFDDDGDEITVASGATLTTFGSFTVDEAGANTNVNAAAGSVVNLNSADGEETITAAANSDYKLLGTVNLSGADASYTLQGPHVFQFGDVNINGTGALINITPSSTMLFAPGSRIDLEERTQATLTVDGQSAATPITLNLTDVNGESFVIDRNSSANLIIQNVNLANATYTSGTGGAAVDEIDLVGVVDRGGNTNVFTPAVVIEEPDEETDGGEETNDGSIPDDGTTNDIDQAITHAGDAVTVNADGRAKAYAVSPISGAVGRVTIQGATSGSLMVIVVDGNLAPDFVGIENETALSATMEISGSVTGDLSAVVELCYSQDMLADSGMAESELVLYSYLEPDGPWELAGNQSQYRGDSEPTSRVGDYGLDSSAQCVWAVRDRLSIFAVGQGPTELAETVVVENDETPDPVQDDPRPSGLCGILGLVYLLPTFLILTAFKQRIRR